MRFAYDGPGAQRAAARRTRSVALVSMRVLMLHNQYKSRGGEDEVVDAESAMLRTSGHDVELLELQNNASATSRKVRTALGAVWSREAHRIVTERLTRRTFDVVHVHNFFPLWSPSVYYAAADNGIAVVQSIHNYRLICPASTLFRDGHHCTVCVGKKIAWPGVVHGCYQGSRPATGAVAAMLATHWALGTWRTSVHQYIAISRYVRDRLVAGHFPENRIAVKPNFVAEPPSSSPRPRKSDYFIFVGRLIEEKGLAVLFRVWSSARNGARLKIVGDGSVPAGLAVPEGIEMLGARPLAETYGLIAGAKALLLPAEWAEPFGRVVIEAFALGTPVIASSAGALPELVEHDVTGLLVDAGDSGALAAAIGRLSSDEALCRRLSEHARRAYLESFTEQVNRDKLVAIYERAIAIRRQAKPGGS